MMVRIHVTHKSSLQMTYNKYEIRVTLPGSPGILTRGKRDGFHGSRYRERPVQRG